MILPFINTNYAYQLDAGIDSISISGHKIIGSPVPCGIVLIHNKYIKHSAHHIDYINNFDCTITGSRSGFAALIFWYAIFKNKHAGFKKFINECLKRAKQFTEILNQEGITAWRYEHAITIVLDKLPDQITQKWRVPSNNMYTTLTALPKLTEEILYGLMSDIKYYQANNVMPTPSCGIQFPQVIPSIQLDFD